MEKQKAVVMLSGGMDSATCLAVAIDSGYSAAVLHLNYGQRTQAKELDSFNKLCDFYGIKGKLVVDVGYFTQIGGSSLTDNKIEVENANLDSDMIPNSYVPFRNGNILAIAASWAEVIGATAIYSGATQADSSGYPDCRQAFFNAFEKAINLGTMPETKIKIFSPLINLTKAGIVALGGRLRVPFELTWSCYQNNDFPCGICDSCALRQRGFNQAGIIDPLLNIGKR